MKEWVMEKKIAMVMAIMVGLFLLSQATLALGKEPISPFPKEKGVQQEATNMKVKFYTIDRQKLTKGEFVGTAEIKEGKLIINVTDPKLEKILKEPYTTMTGEIKEGTAVDKLITYQPGTLEHLRAIAIECYRFDYIGEIVKGVQRK
ncbi:MAG: hypothetical protein DRP68_06470 [Candidatus Omnitrophota bacterium]|nr:MAG: hypothetical protein DRP68_06470 [Candidatus Omnitrophota bacterium]RKY38089.1 MAG: hypothetical protein DRP72_02485 [Candidatus Omnitrophota bacterium]RKY43632.1 MAG: hypothetical protein DRP81_06650 [Candidatus Omnitrophota bacterium]